MPNIYVARNTVFSAATGAKTVLNLIAGAAKGVEIVEFGISMDGVTSSAVPATVELCTSTQGAAGTGAASPPAIVATGHGITAQATSAHNFTVEPTTLVVIEQFYVSQFNGLFVKQYPLDFEPESDTSGGTIKALALRINTSATVNVLAYMRFREQ